MGRAGRPRAIPPPTLCHFRCWACPTAPAGGGGAEDSHQVVLAHRARAPREVLGHPPCRSRRRFGAAASVLQNASHDDEQDGRSGGGGEERLAVPLSALGRRGGAPRRTPARERRPAARASSMAPP